MYDFPKCQSIWFMPNADAGSLGVEHSLFVFKITHGYLFVSKFVENVLNLSYSIALQQIEIKTNIQNTVCGMDDVQVKHFAWVPMESTAEIVHFASQQKLVR